MKTNFSLKNGTFSDYFEHCIAHFWRGYAAMGLRSRTGAKTGFDGDLLWDMGGHFKREKNKLQKSHYGTIVILSDFLGH